MSVSRAVFFETLSTLRSLSDEGLLIDQGIGPNIAATTLRNGLLVAGFSHLQNFAEERLDELIQSLPSSSISYSMMDDDLRHFLVVDSIKGLQNRLRFRQKSEQLSFAERHLPKLAAFSGTPSVYTGLGFNSEGSNLSSADISTVLKRFGVAESWSRMTSLCTELGTSRLNLSSDFDNLVRARNKAAHDIRTNIPTNDLKTHLETILLVGISFDLLLSWAFKCFVSSPTPIAASAVVNRLFPTLRFVDTRDGVFWFERKSSAGKAIKRYADLTNAKSNIMQRSGSFELVVREKTGLPVELISK